jgi:hypothetical protein
MTGFPKAQMSPVVRLKERVYMKYPPCDGRDVDVRRIHTWVVVKQVLKQGRCRRRKKYLLPSNNRSSTISLVSLAL